MRTELSMLDRIDWPPPGDYILAVSGGVDSVVLLHLLATHPESSWHLRVAHFDHGIRPDSGADRRLVQDLASVLGLPFHTEEGRLGDASEERARDARYDFLRRLQKDYRADGIITAHHRDDRLETSVFNAIRGSGRAGLAPMLRTDGIYRPLMQVGKAELQDYARRHGLPWREDPTNSDIRYDRNFVRHELLPLARQEVEDFDTRYSGAVAELDGLNDQIDQHFVSLLHKQAEITPEYIRLPRRLLSEMRQPTLEHFLAFLMRHQRIDAPVSQTLVRRLAHLIKTGAAGSRFRLSETVEADIGYSEVTLFLVGRVAMALTAQELPLHSSLRFGRHEVSYGPLETDDHKSIHIRPLDLKVRRFRAGDRIAPLGLPGRKKLHDMFIDAKVDRADRLSWPVVTTLDDEVVWVPGLSISREHVATEGGFWLACRVLD